MKLSDAMGTRYVTDGNAAQLKELLHNTKTTIDLCDCKITKEIAAIIELYPMRFTDSGDDRRNFILRVNKEAAENREAFGASVVLPRMGNMGISDYLRSIDNTKVYDVLSNSDIPITAFVYVMCPNVKIAVSAYTDQFGGYLARQLYNGDVQKFLQFIEVEEDFLMYEKSMATDVAVRIVGDNVHLSSGEILMPKEALGDYTLIPRRIGHERINNIPMYSEFIQRIYKDASLKPTQELSLYDILTEEVRNG